jgi:uncharacterized damage-inducible protein DinB
MLDYFKKLFEYDFWANERVLASIEAAPAVPEEALKKMSHILAAKAVWLSRLSPGVPTLSFEALLSLPECRKWDADLKKAGEGYLSKLSPEQLSQKVSYKNLKGMPFENVLSDILAHMVNHGSYHRGQIASLVNKAGGETGGNGLYRVRPGKGLKPGLKWRS